MALNADQVREFAERYTDAWCSQDPERVAAQYTPAGSLTINDGPPSVGRAAIIQAAQSFMVAFPDMQHRCQHSKHIPTQSPVHSVVKMRNT